MGMQACRNCPGRTLVTLTHSRAVPISASFIAADNRPIEDDPSRDVASGDRRMPHAISCISTPALSTGLTWVCEQPRYDYRQKLSSLILRFNLYPR